MFGETFFFRILVALTAWLALAQAWAKPCRDLLGSQAPALDINKPTIVIVDAYSSGRFLAPAFYDAGYQVIHIHSAGVPAISGFVQTFFPGNFTLDIPHRGNIAETLRALSPLTDIRAVETGADSGVLFTDELRYALQSRFPSLPNDGINIARKHKFFQNEELARHGVDSALQLKTGRFNEALAWTLEQNLFESHAGKVVVKPMLSGGTDGVHFAAQELELKKAFANLIGKPDEFGQINHEVLLSEYLEGIEYVINGRVSDGHVVITGIWQYTKRMSAEGHRLIYDHDVLLPFEGKIQASLVDYSLRVLGALGMNNSNFHLEVKRVPKRGNVAVEMNARMMGSGQPSLEEIATGHSQVDRTVLSIQNLPAFKSVRSGYTIKKHAMMVSIANYVEGGLLRPEAAALVTGLPGYVHHSFQFKPGEPMSKTIDMASSVGDVWLAHENPRQLARTLQAIRDLERRGAFTSH